MLMNNSRGKYHIKVRGAEAQWMGVGSGGEPPGGGSGPEITPGGASFRRPVVETDFTYSEEKPVCAERAEVCL